MAYTSTESEASIHWLPSAHAYHRILKLARTIADLEGNGEIQMRYLAEEIVARFHGELRERCYETVARRLGL